VVLGMICVQLNAKYRYCSAEGVIVRLAGRWETSRGATRLRAGPGVMITNTARGQNHP
jgi:hypothetical protein